jgi:hypothetical protein
MDAGLDAKIELMNIVEDSLSVTVLSLEELSV